MTTLFRTLVLLTFILSTPVQADWMALDIQSNSTPACVAEYHRFLDAIKKERVAEIGILLKGISVEKNTEYKAQLKNEVVHRVLYQYLEQTELNAFYLADPTQSSERGSHSIVINSFSLYEQMIKHHQFASSISLETFQKILRTELEHINAVAKSTELVTFGTEMKEELINEIKWGVWAALDHAFLDFLTFELPLTALSIGISASRIPPENEWMTAIEERPSLLLHPTVMKKMGFIQKGETAEVISCLTFQRKTAAIHHEIKKLIGALRTNLNSTIIDIYYPQPVIAKGFDGKPRYSVDATYIYQDVSSYRVLPAWAK